VNPGARRENTRTEALVLWVISIGAFLLIWQLIGMSGDVFAITPFTEVVPELIHQLAEEDLLSALAGTLGLAGLGLVISIVVAVPVGILAGASKRAAWVIEPLLNAGYATPLVIVLPILGLYLGFGLQAKLLIVFLFCFFVIAINTASGVRSVSRDAREMANAFCLGPLEVERKVTLRAASPEILTGIRIGVSRAIQGALLGDLLLRADNFGLYLIESGATFQISALLGGIFLITIVASTLMFAMRMLERRLMRWKPTG
jgi:ABC-type nitrate/sulfonate/bicarbonate transport system permease component